MSIAVSALVKPSRTLMIMVLAMATGCLAIGTAIGTGAIGSMTIVPRLLLALLCALATLGSVTTVMLRRGLQRIDISGTGQIRLGYHAPPGANQAGEQYGAAVPHRIFQLLPTSTLWSVLMILNLRADDGFSQTLLVLPDTMPQTSFRALSVACRWIAAHNIRAKDENS